MFPYWLHNRFGLTARIIKSSELRLIADEKSASGYTLCCLSSPNTTGPINANGITYHSFNGEILEQVHQARLQLHQRELEALDDDTLRALAPISLNDFRTIYLVHDKRMLGIIHQELDSLVHEHHTLSPEEAEILRAGIVHTRIPGSVELRNLLDNIRTGKENKDHFVLKLVGSGKGKGIIFGSDITKEAFVEALERLMVARVDGKLHVVQKMVEQPRFDVFVPEKNGRSPVSSQNIVGSIFMVNGQSLGMGMFRSSSDRVCALAEGGSWMCALVPE